MKIDRFLAESPLFAITKTARILEAGLNRALNSEKLSFLHGLVLVAIFFEDPVKVTPSQLAESFSTTRGNMSHCLSLLEARGMVRRQIDPSDARVFRITVRPEGKKSAIRLIARFNSLQKSLEQDIGMPDLRSTLEVITRIELFCSRPDPAGARRAARL